MFKSRNWESKPVSGTPLMKTTLYVLGVAAFFTVINDDWPVTPSLRVKTKKWSNPIGRRGLSISLGNGQCRWQPPSYDVPDDIDFHKTLIAGFPSCDKRMIFVQMEALTGWPAKDEWDFEYLGMSNHPFIKANYPHHEGVWGWQDAADQVVMMVRNIRKSMVEYHDILWDIGYAKTWEEATINIDNLYNERPPLEDFLVWRDDRVMEEAHWYGWFIDYWMEGGLMRDMFTHKITTQEHWDMLMVPTAYTREELDYDVVVGNQTVTPTYDPHCANGEISGGCEPVAVISAEKLRDYTEGPSETTRIAEALMNNDKISKYVIDSDAWNCIWDELIVQGKGLKMVYDRPGYTENDYNFSAEMLQEMIHELDRLITKYSSAEWNTKQTANRLVELLTEHRGLVQTELDEVLSGVRKLGENDFLGPEKRRELALEKAKREGYAAAPKKKDDKKHSEYFSALERSLVERRREQMKMNAIAKGKVD